MREAFFALLVILLLFVMLKGLAFRIVIDGEPHVMEVVIEVLNDDESEEPEIAQVKEEP